MVADASTPSDGTSGAPLDATVLPDDLIDTLGRGLRRLRRSMVKPPQAVIPIPSLGRPVDIAKVFACDAIAELTDSGRSVTVKDVAVALELEHSTVSRLLGEAEADGLLIRSEDPTDRRRTTVSLTVLGRQMVSDSTAMRRFLARTVLASWERADVETLTRLTTRLADALGGRMDALTERARQEFGIALDPGPAGTPNLTRPVEPTH